ncbi:tetratricopeptide repeat protein [Lysinibacillus sp. NPDC093688]|uniref:tetratricopeptide repeat protein n=1 Tax=Lysinibacillus sp. NPDC093688 TaxID=3390577 RepID=UPI003CFF6CF0
MVKSSFGRMVVRKLQSVNFHNRVPLKDIKNLNNWEKGFDKGFPYYEEGDKERKSGNIIGAIELFDKARFNGYNAPALYSSYAKAYRKLKDYDNEIAILDEAIERLKSEVGNNETRIMEFNERRTKAIALKCK